MFDGGSRQQHGSDDSNRTAFRPRPTSAWRWRMGNGAELSGAALQLVVNLGAILLGGVARAVCPSRCLACPAPDPRAPVRVTHWSRRLLVRLKIGDATVARGQHHGRSCPSVFLDRLRGEVWTTCGPRQERRPRNALVAEHRDGAVVAVFAGEASH